jgi:Nucleotidyltransferase domain.
MINSNIDEVYNLIPQIQESEISLLVGSLADGTATIDSDIDILLIPKMDIKHVEESKEFVAYDSKGREINVVVLSGYDTVDLLARLKMGIDSLLPEDSQQTQGKFQRFSIPERRSLHRIYQGIPLVNNKSKERILKQYRIDKLYVYLAYYYLVGYFAYIKKAKTKANALGKIIGTSMLDVAVKRLIGAILASIKVTNPTEEWRPYLLDRNSKYLALEDVKYGIKYAFLSPESDINENIEQVEWFAEEAIERIFQRDVELLKLKDIFNNKANQNRLGDSIQSKG